MVLRPEIGDRLGHLAHPVVLAKHIAEDPNRLFELSQSHRGGPVPDSSDAAQVISFEIGSQEDTIEHGRDEQKGGDPFPLDGLQDPALIETRQNDVGRPPAVVDHHHKTGGMGQRTAVEVDVRRPDGLIQVHEHIGQDIVAYTEGPGDPLGSSRGTGGVLKTLYVNILVHRHVGRRGRLVGNQFVVREATRPRRADDNHMLEARHG